MTLTEFLLARIAEDEEIASHGDGGLMDDAHFSRERVLAECQAKRRIVDWHGPFLNHPNYAHSNTAQNTLHYLAAVYADHPDYSEEWRV